MIVPWSVGTQGNRIRLARPAWLRPQKSLSRNRKSDRCGNDGGRQAEGVDQFQSARTGQRAEAIDGSPDGPGLDRLEVAGLQEPGRVTLDCGEREKRAHRLETGRVGLA